VIRALGLALVVAGCVGRGEAAIDQPIATVVDAPPPPPRAERIEQRDGHQWVRGHWQRRGSQWLWRAGRWERERSREVWSPGHWVLRAGRYHWVEGRWVSAAGARVRPR
jgi:hypothetical protein